MHGIQNKDEMLIIMGAPLVCLYRFEELSKSLKLGLSIPWPFPYGALGFRGVKSASAFRLGESLSPSSSEKVQKWVPFHQDHKRV